MFGCSRPRAPERISPRPNKWEDPMLRHVFDALRHQYLGAIALFLALGGTSYALALDEGSVGTREIRTGDVRSVDIRHNAVKSPQIARAAVKARNIAHNAVTPSKI